MADYWEPDGFSVVREIGRGAMGIVYEAVDIGLGRSVAIKAFAPEVTTDPTLIRRFEREARAVAAISHPNVVTIHSIGKSDGRHYLVMELVAGQTLADFVASRGAVPAAEAVEITCQICDGVGAAHKNDLIHRDIKPHNILISPDGRIKVTDFGLVTMAAGLSDLSFDGIKVGTPRYMAPESCRGDRATFQTDIYGIGTVFYEMLTGEPAFQGDNVLSVMKNIEAGSFPKLEDKLPGIGAGLSQLVELSTHENPEERFSSCSNFSKALRAWLNDADSPTIVMTPYIESEGPDSDRAVPVSDPESESFDVALAHHSKDDNRATRLLDFLARSGYKARCVVLDVPEKFAEGKSLLDESKCVTALMSIHTATSLPTEAQAELESLREKLVPVLLDKTTPFDFVDQSEIVRLYALDDSTQVSTILEVIEQKVERSVVPDPDQTAAIMPFSESLDDTPERPVDPVSNAVSSTLPGIPGVEDLTNALSKRLAEAGDVVSIALDNPAQYIAVDSAIASLKTKRRYNYDVVWTLDATNSLTLAMSFSKLAANLPLQIEEDADLRTRLHALRQWLGSAKHWLVVVSGTANEYAIRPYIPETHVGQLVYVCPASEASGTDSPIRLKKANTKLVRSSIKSTQAEVDKDTASELRDLFGDQSLCYYLANAYLKTFEIAADAYAEEVEFTSDMLAHRYPDWDKNRCNLMAAIALTIERLTGWSAEATRILRLLTLLHGASISPRIIESISALNDLRSSRTSSAESFEDCLTILVSLGFVLRTRDGFRMDTVLRDRLSEWADGTANISRGSSVQRLLRGGRTASGGKTSWAYPVITWAEQRVAQDMQKTRGWRDWLHDLPHIHAMLERCVRTDVDPSLRLRVWEGLAKTYAQRGLLEYSSGAYRRAISLTIGEMNSAPEELCRLYLGLAEVYNRRGDHSRALVSLTEALPLWDQLPPDAQDTEYVLTVANLAETTLQSGDRTGAHQAWQRANAFSERLPKRANAGRVNLHETLADLALRLGDTKAAINHFAIALAASDTLPTDEQSASRRLLRKLAAQYRSIGEPERAVPYAKRVADETEKRYGPDHSRLVKDLYALAMAYAESEDYPAAVTEMRRTRDCAKEAYGTDHREYALIAFNLGTYLQRTGEWTEAAECYESALSVLRNVLPGNHHYVQTATNSLDRVREKLANG